jgi:hypothetical protein
MSQFKVSGVVDRDFTKTKKTKFGDKIIHYASVDGQEFSTGFKKVFTSGEMVNCVVEHKFGEYQLVEGVAPGTQPALGSAPPPAAKGNFGGGGFKGASKGTFPVGKTDGQMSIIRQNSMNRAVEIMSTWIQAGIWSGDEEAYIRKLHEVALTITDFNSGQDIMKLKAAQAANLQVAS